MSTYITKNFLDEHKGGEHVIRHYGCNCVNFKKAKAFDLIKQKDDDDLYHERGCETPHADNKSADFLKTKTEKCERCVHVSF